MTEFEDSFFDDLIADIEKLRATNPSGNYDAGWNSAVKMCIFMHSLVMGRYRTES